MAPYGCTPPDLGSSRAGKVAADAAGESDPEAPPAVL